MNILETERLVIRQFTLGDTAFIIKLLNTPGWLQFIGDRNVRTREQAENYLLNGPLKSYSENGYGLWLVETREHFPIGMSGIIKRADLESPDIGFSFLPEWSGKGYGFEAANAVLSFAQKTLQLPIILAITNTDNEASIKLLDKIGLHFVKIIIFPPKNEELMLFTTEKNSQ